MRGRIARVAGLIYILADRALALVFELSERSGRHPALPTCLCIATAWSVTKPRDLESSNLRAVCIVETQRKAENGKLLRAYHVVWPDPGRGGGSLRRQVLDPRDLSR